MSRALARWRTDDGSLAGPDAFIPRAESDGSIVALGRHVLETATRDIARLQQRGLSPHVDVSPCQLLDGLFPIHVHNALADSGLSPRQLVLELTEGRCIPDVRETATTLSRLHEVGIRTALDDFGVGRSSPSRLRRLPVSIIKIDARTCKQTSRRFDDARRSWSAARFAAVLTSSRKGSRSQPRRTGSAGSGAATARDSCTHVPYRSRTFGTGCLTAGRR